MTARDLTDKFRHPPQSKDARQASFDAYEREHPPEVPDKTLEECRREEAERQHGVSDSG